MWALRPVGKEVFFNLEGIYIFPALPQISLYTFYKSIQVLAWPGLVLLGLDC